MANAIDLTTLNNVKDILSIPTSNTQADATIAMMITQASLFWLQQTSLWPDDGTVPTVSPLVQVCTFSDWLDGSGSQAQYVKNPPIRSIEAVVVDGSTLPAASYKIGYGGDAVILPTGNISFLPTFRSYFSSYFGGCRNVFNNGIQNVNVQYHGGFDSTPFDVVNACSEMVALTFRKRGWVGKSSIALAQGGGTESYQKWAIEPWVMLVIKNYARKAIV